jgi:hypothetical protein
MFISLTRLRLRRWWYLPEFFWRSARSIAQAKSSVGFLAGATLADKRRTFWTMTGWENEAAMKAYRGVGAHQAAMKRLPGWCDEACVAHYSADGLPSWAEAWDHMTEHARFTPVDKPSQAHLEKRIDPLRPKLQQKI